MQSRVGGREMEGKREWLTDVNAAESCNAIKYIGVQPQMSGYYESTCFKGIPSLFTDTVYILIVSS